jgi:hypothetical protein
MVFQFSVVVNMILINMMIAIITMAFEEIKENEEAFQSKFQFVSYLRRRTREVVGTRVAKSIKPVYVDPNEIPLSDDEMEEDA